MSIDDLFSSAEPQHATKPAAPLVIRVVSLVAISALFTALIYVVLLASGVQSPPPVIFAVMLVLIGLARYTRRLRPGPRPRQAGLTAEETVTVPDGLKLAVNRWDVMLDWCHTDAGRFNRRVLPRLGELADERLRQKFGFTRAVNPQGARQKLGDPLWTFVTMPHRRVPHPKELEQMIDVLEKL